MSGHSRSIKLGIIGCGWVPELLHVPALKQVGMTDIVAVADDHEDRLKRVADRFRVPRRCSDYRTLLDDPAIEAVGVWLPGDRQVEAVQAVLAAGKHLFIDKPLVFDLKVWDRLIEQAAQANKKIMIVGLPRRWHRHVRHAREVIRQGVLGDIALIRTILTGKNPERRTIQEEGTRHAVKGILYQFGVHHFDTLQALVQRDVQEICATSSADGLTVVVTARLSDGIMVSSTFAESENKNDEIEVVGQTGQLKISCYRFDGFEHVPSGSHPGDVQARARQVIRTIKELPQGLWRMRRGGDFIDSTRVGWQHCLDAIQRDTRPACTLEEGRRVLQVILAAKESLEIGRPVTLRPRSQTVEPQVTAESLGRGGMG